MKRCTFMKLYSLSLQFSLAFELFTFVIDPSWSCGGAYTSCVRVPADTSLVFPALRSIEVDPSVKTKFELF
jgi:hypothetical protein